MTDADFEDFSVQCFDLATVRSVHFCIFGQKISTRPRIGRNADIYKDLGSKTGVEDREELLNYSFFSYYPSEILCIS